MSPPQISREDRAPDPAEELALEWGAQRRRRPTGPRLGVVGWLRWGWRQLTSMRTALVLLVLLAVAAVPGSVLPQRTSDPLAVNDWIERNPGTAATMDRLGMFDVFAAPWFSAVYILLFVSLIGCVLPRIASHARAIRAPIPAPPRHLDRVDGVRSWTTSDPGVLAAAAGALRSGRWRVAGSPAGATGWVAAEKGFARETGNLLFHIALVLILVGVALGALLGWKGTVIVREGSGFANTLTQYDSFSPGRLTSGEGLPPFSFTLSDFDATFEREGSQRGAPRSFAATLDYRAAPGEPAQTRAVSVNSPLRVDGAKVFLLGHGYAPHLRVTDATGRVVLDDTVVFLPQDGSFTSTGVVKAPDASPQLGLQGILAPTAALDAVRGPHSTFPAPDDPAVFLTAFTGDLGMDAGVPRNVFTLETEGLQRLGIEALRPGQSWQLPDGQGAVEFVDLQRWASFRVSHDPGKVLALVAAGVAIVGVMLSLFVRRRRIWVRVEPSGDQGLRVLVAGVSRSEAADVSGEVEQLVARMGGPGIEEGQ